MQALAGIKIIDLSRLLPGPYCSMLLADFGAEVIKVEAPGEGDYMRTFPPQQNGFGFWHLQVNRNKKSVVLDLKTAEGREEFWQLVRTADVVIESYRPGVIERLGVDYQKAKKINPKIIYCTINGYGKTGPRRDEADHDLNYASLAGIVSLSGEPGGRPSLPGVQIADLSAAPLAAVGILTAIRHAEKTGEGQEIEVSLYNAALTTMPGAAALYFGGEMVAKRGNNWLTGKFPNYALYETRDGRYMAVGALEKKFWRNLCLVIGREDLIETIDDKERYEWLIAELTQIFRQKTMLEWVELLANKDTCTTPVLNFDEAVESEQTKAAGMVLELEDEERGAYRQIGFPVKMSLTPATFRNGAPKLAEHNEEVLGKKDK